MLHRRRFLLRRALPGAVLLALALTALLVPAAPAQRKRMKEMMKGKMGNMSKMMDRDDQTSFTMKVKALRVNEGPPSDGQ